MSASHSNRHQRRQRVKRFSAFDNFFLRDIMDMFSGSDGGGLGPLTPSRCVGDNLLEICLRG